MDASRRALGLDARGAPPAQLRSAPATRPRPARCSRTTSTCGALLDRALAASEWHAQRAALREGERRRRARCKRGIGLALFFHGTGFTGSAEKRPRVDGGARGDRRRRGVRVLAASTEIGQGTRTMLAQIVADTLGVPLRRRRGQRGPTRASCPTAGPTVASRTCMVVGKLVERRRVGMRRRRCGRASTRRAVPRRARATLAKHGPLVVTSEYEPPRRHVAGTTQTIAATPTAAYALGRATSPRSRSIRDTYEARVDRLRRGARRRQGDPPDARDRPDRGRRRAGHRLGALEDVVLARRPHGERAS